MMVWKNIVDFTIKILQINISLIIKNNFNIYLLCYKYLPIILVKFVIFLAFYKIFIIVNFHLLNFISHTLTHIYIAVILKQYTDIDRYWNIVPLIKLKHTPIRNWLSWLKLQILKHLNMNWKKKKKKLRDWTYEHNMWLHTIND